MSLTTVKGMQSEIFVPITPPMVWTPVTKEFTSRGCSSPPACTAPRIIPRN